MSSQLEDVEPRWLVHEVQPSTARGRRTQERIIAAAKQLFSTSRYCDVSIADIVTASRLSIGSFYRYFDNKEDVFLVLLSRVFWGMYEETRGSWHAEDAADANITRTTHAYLKSYYDNRFFLRSAIETIGTSDRVRTMWSALRRDLYRHMIVRLRQDQAASPLPSLDSTITMRSLGGMVEEYAARAFCVEEFGTPAASDVEHAASVLAGIWFRTIFGTGEVLSGSLTDDEYSTGPGRIQPRQSQQHWEET
jgi:AcrR family transcriptional regulator